MSTKRVPIDLNLNEINILLDGLNALRNAKKDYPKIDFSKVYDLEERLENEQMELEEHDKHSRMYKEDKDGYLKLTQEGWESLAENYNKEDE